MESPTRASVNENHARKQPKKSILKPPPPPTNAQKLNLTIQHGLTSLKRDFLGGIYGTAATASTSADVNSAHANGTYARTVTQTNTSNNAAAPFWKSALRQYVSIPQHFESASTSSNPPATPASPSNGTPAPAHSSPSSSLDVDSMKSVRFRMSSLTVVYPLTADASPADESLTRERVNSEHRKAILDRIDGKSWNGADLACLYQDCCKSREEQPIPRILALLLQNPSVAPKALDLSNLQLSLGAAEALSDVLSVDFGLKKLVLDGCGLEDESLKAILHSLLVSASLPTLSLANNKKVKAKGWRFLAVFVRKANALRYLDISDNTVDRRTADWLVQAMGTPSHLSSTSSIPDILSEKSHPSRSKSLPLEPDEQNPLRLDDPFSTPLMPIAPLLREIDDTGQATIISIRLENCSIRNQALDSLAHGVRHSAIKHISLRRNKINPLGAVALAIMMRDYAVASDTSTSSSGSALSYNMAQSNSVDNLAAAADSSLLPSVRKILPSLPLKQEPGQMEEEEHVSGLATREELRSKLSREIGEQPRIGNLVTLDIKNNDIRHGVNYLAQVLKRNRTLKVLNLSENRIDVAGLCALAEALRFNSSLETLDMSHNPCCGPRLEGVIALRSAFVSNTALMRVFLNATDLNAEGAICLAEYLPELETVVHLDLTENFEIDIAGVMALSVAVKMNRTLRCLDLNIPANDPDFARLSQDILQSCIRNTEAAQEELAAKGSKQSVSAPMLKSTVARNLEDRQQKIKAITERRKERLGDMMAASTECRDLLSEVFHSAKEDKAKAEDDLFKDVLSQAQAAQMQLAEGIQHSADSDIKTEATALSDELSQLCQAASALAEGKPLPSELLIPPPLSPNTPPVPSPSFSITDSDEESEEDEAQTQSENQPQHTHNRPPKLSLSIQPAANGFVSDSQPKSPIESASRFLTMEEGEVFRKKTILDAENDSNSETDDEQEDVSGEVLRQEILTADVPQRTSSHSPTITQDPQFDARAARNDEKTNQAE